MTQPVDGISVSCDETTNRCQRLRESTHNQVNLISQSEVITNTTSLTTEYANTMSLVNHD